MSNPKAPTYKTMHDQDPQVHRLTTGLPKAYITNQSVISHVM
jgi:hypothetical protein